MDEFKIHELSLGFPHDRQMLIDFLSRHGLAFEDDIETAYGIFTLEEELAGCGCAAVVLAAYILPKLSRKEWKRVLLVPTGALLSKVSFNEGKSIPGIAHGVVLECI